ncbi:antibiotic biosynthesis monooxygenase family protein [Deinococcus ficus]|uniref:Antibiotic biosynthesis monooxygenase n=1 Tax=Deinococcus ficus TaxID=317577 RepID=A0A221T1D5_9DEIO|nr:antibiotic biosynthesis monooxygenase [Deinococcus ficus]ASN82686.1 antibiotic biosynthesis monooxygenase [Deinococcus ficus]
MFVVHNRITVPAEHASTFEQMFTDSFKHLASFPGLTRTTLQRPRQPDQPYVSTMEWESAEAFQDWMKSGSFRASHALPEGAPRDAMGSSSVIETFETISDLRYS